MLRGSRGAAFLSLDLLHRQLDAAKEQFRPAQPALFDERVDLLEAFPLDADRHDLRALADFRTADALAEPLPNLPLLARQGPRFGQGDLAVHRTVDPLLLLGTHRLELLDREVAPLARRAPPLHVCCRLHRIYRAILDWPPAGRPAPPLYRRLRVVSGIAWITYPVTSSSSMT